MGLPTHKSVHVAIALSSDCSAYINVISSHICQFRFRHVSGTSVRQALGVQRKEGKELVL